MTMTLKDLEGAYIAIKDRPHRGSFYIALWSEQADVERAFEMWITEKHPDFFNTMGSRFEEHERHLVKSGKTSEIFEFLQSLPKALSEKAWADIRRVSGLDTSVPAKHSETDDAWKIAADELDELQDYFGYPYFESEWHGFDELEKAMLEWLKKNRAAFLKEQKALRASISVADLEAEIRNREGAKVIIEFLDSLPEAVAKKAIAILRSRRQQIAGK